VDEHHVLIVEDDAAIRTLVEVITRRCGYVPVSVSHGNDAIAALSAGSYCAVILDLMMPEVSGYDVIEHIRKNSIVAPVIVMTAALKALEPDRLDPDVVVAVLTKPFAIERLTDALQEACA
jgi:two-component system, NtrC family, response regulator AtoC